MNDTPDELKKKHRPAGENSPPPTKGGPGDDRQAPGGSQPGGGRHSESEKPDSPDSRWGSGHKR